jgi:hypothetical protein
VEPLRLALGPVAADHLAEVVVPTEAVQPVVVRVDDRRRPRRRRAVRRRRVLRRAQREELRVRVRVWMRVWVRVRVRVRVRMRVGVWVWVWVRVGGAQRGRQRGVVPVVCVAVVGLSVNVVRGQTGRGGVRVHDDLPDGRRCRRFRFGWDAGCDSDVWVQYRLRRWEDALVEGRVGLVQRGMCARSCHGL